MKKVTKSAVAMVLAGSVTFSIANALLVHTTPKRLIENALTISADRKRADVINEPAKKNIAPTSTTNVKDLEIAAVQVSSKNNAAIEPNREIGSKRTTTNPDLTTETAARKPVATPLPVTSAKATSATSKPTTTRTTTTRTTTTSTAKKPVTAAKPVTVTKPVAVTKPATTTKTGTSTKAPTTTSKPATTTSPTTTNTNTKKTTAATTNTNKNNTTTTNRGQQVSQEAKEKAASRKDNKENNVDKM